MTPPPVPPDPANPAPHVPAEGYDVLHGNEYHAGEQGGQPGIDPLISLDFSGWWARGMSIARAGWRPLAVLQLIGFGVLLLVQVPIAVWAALLTDDLVSSMDSGASPEFPDPGVFLAGIGLGLLGIFVLVVVSNAVTVASIHVGVSIALGERAQIGAALRNAMQRVLPLLGWQIVSGFIILAGICACVLPAIYLAAVFTVLPAVVAFERTNVISRCFRLFHSDLGAAVARVATIAGLTLAAGFLGSILSTVINAVAGVPTGFGGVDASVDVSTGTLVVATAVGTLLSAAIGRAVAVLTTPLVLTAYADLRARVEPLATPVLAREIGLRQ